MPGHGVDASGGPVVDPTQNVLDLVEAAVKRLDDLRDVEARHVREMTSTIVAHAAELRVAEKARIDAIRAVDVNAVQRAAEVSAQQATTLAAQVALSAEAVRVTLAAAMDPIQKDIADLRRAQYEAQGKTTQGADTRLNVGALLGALAVLLTFVFGAATLAVNLIGR